MPSIAPLVLLFAGAAQAAEVTDLAPNLRGDFEIRYDLDAEHAKLVEGEATVGKRRILANTVTYAARFSVYHGLGIFIELPQVASEGVKYRDAQQMALDPRADVGTMIGGDTLSALDVRRGSGVVSPWIGLSGTPMSPTLFPARGDRTTWKIDLGYRFKDQTNFWTYGPNDVIGGGVGASALRLRTAVSSSYRKAEPYGVVDLVRTGTIRTDIVDANGAVTAKDLELQPASSATLRAGVEWLVATYGDDGARVSIDAHTQFGYRGGQRLPSGVYLPSVLDASDGLVVTMSDRTELLGGAGVNWRFMEYLQLNVGGDFGANSGGRVENVYPIDAKVGARMWQVHTTLRFRARDPMFDGLKTPPSSGG